VADPGKGEAAEQPGEQTPAPLSRETIQRGALASLFAWLLPGAGHLYLGKKIRALAFFLVVGCFAGLGLGMEGQMYRPEPGKPLKYLASFANLGLGPTYVFPVAMGRLRGNPESSTWEYGNTFLLTAGIMNILLMLDAWDIATNRKK
jgi:hypothetical protein